MNSRFMNWNKIKRVSKLVKTVHSSFKVFNLYKTFFMSPVHAMSKLENQKHSLGFLPKGKKKKCNWQRRKNNNTEGKTVCFLISCNVLLFEKRCTFELFNWKLKSSTFLWWSFWRSTDKVFYLLSLWMKFFRMAIQMKALQQYLTLTLFAFPYFAQ